MPSERPMGSPRLHPPSPPRPSLQHSCSPEYQVVYRPSPTYPMSPSQVSRRTAAPGRGSPVRPIPCRPVWVHPTPGRHGRDHPTPGLHRPTPRRVQPYTVVRGPVLAWHRLPPLRPHAPPARRRATPPAVPRAAPVMTPPDSPLPPTPPDKMSLPFLMDTRPEATAPAFVTAHLTPLPVRRTEASRASKKPPRPTTCGHCGRGDTIAGTAWRRSPFDRSRYWCNACTLYWNKNKVLRPTGLFDRPFVARNKRAEN